MTRCSLTIAVLALLATTSLEAANAKVASAAKTFPVPNHGGLELTIPGGWKDTVKSPPRPDFPPTIELTTDGSKFLVLISPIPSRDGDPGFNSPTRLRKLSEAQSKRMLSSAKETTVSLEEFKGDKAVGYFWTVTDKAPDPGSFEYATTAYVGVGDLLVSCTILHHEKESAERQAAIEMLKGAVQKAAAAPTELRVSAPGGGWDLVLPVKGLAVLDEQADEKRKSKNIMAADEKTGLTVSVFMEPSRKQGDHSTVRDVYWGRAKNSPMKKDNIKLDKVGDYATVDYIVPDIEGQAIQQKNVNVYIAHEGVWIDVHLSKVEFTEKDQPLFNEAVKGIRFEKSAPVKAAKK
jgi:hypothetical protein